MTEQQTLDREKKIAEIRDAMERIDRGDFSEIAGAHEKSGEWLRFLLSELERLEREYAEERAAHNAHVTELCELDQENRKLREERQKLIEGLRKLAKTNAENISEIREWKAKQNDPEVIDLDWYNYVARDILKEIGVTDV